MKILNLSLLDNKLGSKKLQKPTLAYWQHWAITKARCMLTASTYRRPSLSCKHPESADQTGTVGNGFYPLCMTSDLTVLGFYQLNKASVKASKQHQCRKKAIFTLFSSNPCSGCLHTAQLLGAWWTTVVVGFLSKFRLFYGVGKLVTRCTQNDQLLFWWLTCKGKSPRLKTLGTNQWFHINKPQ